MPRVSKSALDGDIKELECIHEMAQEPGGGRSGTYRHHAQSANWRIERLVAAGRPLPDWLVRNRVHLRVCGWKVPEPVEK